MSGGCHARLAQVSKIAVLRPNAVGDFIFALPALHALKHAYPAAQLVYLGKQWHADFLAQRGGPIDQVAVLPPCPGVGMPADAPVDAWALRSFIETMRRAEFDIAIQLYGGGHYSNPFVMQLGARLAIGMRAVDAPALDRWVTFGPLQNRRLHLLEVAALIGANRLHLKRELHVTHADRQEAAQVLPDHLSRPLVVIQPGASDRRRCWPAARFAQAADACAKHGACIAVNGTAQEAPIVHEVIERMHAPAIDLSGRLSLSGLCGVLERASLVISNDTGPLHLALALDVPCVGIYWLTNLVESGPLRQHRHRAALSTRIHCPVCGMENLKTRCAHDASFVEEVAVEEVVGWALELLNEACSEAWSEAWSEA